MIDKTSVVNDVKDDNELWDLESQDNKTCIICLDIIDININSQFNNTNCECSYNAHNECMNKWFNEKKSCIMCRKTTEENDNSPNISLLNNRRVINRQNTYRTNCLNYITLFVTNFGISSIIVYVVREMFY